jgi:site-specific DNA recombinase
VQEDLIRAWASARASTLLELFVELDESGGRRDRPLIEQALRRVEAGVSDGIVVARLDRFGRSLSDGLAAIDRIRRAGGSFFVAQDGLDASTDSGRLVLRILFSIAEWDLDHVRESWAEAKARAVDRGTYTGPWLPPGYRKTRARRLRPDPAVAPLITEAFRRRASGESFSGVARWLQHEGVLTGCGNPGWTATTAARVLSNPVYLGDLRSGKLLKEHAHPPLIDAATFELAQRPRRTAAPVGGLPALLRGLVRCASCSLTMSPVTRQRGGRLPRYYVCRGSSAAGRCPAPACITATVLEPIVEDVVLA